MPSDYKNVRITLRGCCLAVLCVAVALASTQSLKNPVFPTPLFFAAIVISTWYGGGISGLLALILAAMALNYYFIPPVGSFALNKPESPYLAEFAIPALLTLWFVKKRRITETSLRLARDDAESRVRERQAELARVTRLVTVGELGVSVAHEVNQPLMATALNSEACLRWLEANPPNLEEAREAATRTIEQANRAGEIVKRIRALLKKSDPHVSPVNMNEAIEDTITLLRSEIEKNEIVLRTELSKKPAMVAADRVQLQQVILNLLMNAIESVCANSQNRREVTVRSETQDGGPVTVFVEDTGAGLPPGDPEQMFAAFFTTKPQGLGMGLSISRTIVESHGGRLWTRDSGGGAVFGFSLPGA